MNDKILRDGLEMLLLHSSPRDVLNRWVYNGPDWRPSYLSITDQLIHQLARRYPDRYSLDDSQNVYNALKSNYESQQRPLLGIFGLVIEFSKQTLIEKEHQPQIKYSEVLRWRNSIHPLGTTPFVCAFLADQDRYLVSERSMFSFNPVLATDNLRLKSILDQGISENHFHLKGSTPPFLLSWICLMNDMENRQAEFVTLDQNPLSESLDNTNRKLYVLVWQAAAIRVFLFDCLNKATSPSSVNFINLSQLQLFLQFEKEEECELHTLKLQSAIEGLRMLNRVPISDDFTPDYAIKYLARHEKDKTYDIFSGEYWFQYKMFETIIRGDYRIMPYIDLFYAYLLIYIRFRSELVQSNKLSGFQNFNEFDKRKSCFISRNDHYLVAQKRIAAMTNLSDKRIVSFEARIVPDSTSTELSKQIREIDAIIKLAIIENKDSTLDKMYYVLHIPKRRDSVDYATTSAFIDCRNIITRQYASEVSNAVTILRDGCDPVAKRIRGIDACSNEIGCRPEVFAPTYRSLKKHQPAFLHLRNESFPMLNITYHVGEDFLDIVDGLRALWEAVTFLELDRSDRLGHALALGINVGKWYTTKLNRIFLPRQDLLDNCAWLLDMLGIYGELSPKLSHELNQICSTQYANIFQKNIPYNENEPEFNLTVYINSLKLRGDEPYYYEFYQNHIIYEQNLDDAMGRYPYALRNDDINSDLHEIRRHNIQAIRLYHHYHFNPGVKKAGSEIVEHKVSDLYIEGAINVQRILQKYIAKKGIGIEANPSSNVLIGNFNRYDCHPLVAFNDMNLFDNQNNPLLFVSINTDDQGVFDTCLENEYALIARGIEQMTNGDGDPVVSSTKIYTWIDNVRKMGLDQRFNRRIE